MTSTNQVIPAAAVEAARIAWVDYSSRPGDWELESALNAALEAAAPHMLAAAWDEGAEADADTWCLTAIPCGDCPNCIGPQIVNPYRTPDAR